MAHKHIKNIYFPKKTKFIDICNQNMFFFHYTVNKIKSFIPQHDQPDMMAILPQWMTVSLKSIFYVEVTGKTIPYIVLTGGPKEKTT